MQKQTSQPTHYIITMLPAASTCSSEAIRYLGYLEAPHTSGVNNLPIESGRVCRARVSRLKPGVPEKKGPVIHPLSGAHPHGWDRLQESMILHLSRETFGTAKDAKCSSWSLA